ncbi:DUF3093 domain-containing protein [Leucobacter ruminantium]|uniref:DUF3093 domain-containing protein n=1 Tax=Leucobacter ruminantium TaxID=1289170 RepID=A0A939LWP3_9MICO|nr:DUF3093 domain-containing protein [Leucobacter ruminantium]MBO1806204.1 DUF3093 domain-containing protein [Leucobacter ruminantium]
MTSDAPATAYRERLVPGIGLFAAVLLLAPAVAMVTLPIASEYAIPAGACAYLLVALVLFLSSPSVRVSDGRLFAGRAQIPVDQLGEVELLGAEALREAIGPELDARSYLLVRGWIHRGVRIENIDPADPAPYWIITSRRPRALADAIASARTR